MMALESLFANSVENDSNDKIYAEIRQELTRLSSKVSNAPQDAVLREVVSLIDKARQILFNAQR